MNPDVQVPQSKEFHEEYLIAACALLRKAGYKRLAKHLFGEDIYSRAEGHPDYS